ncbi:MAG: hypothetical protein QXT71_00990 [Thermoplasmata archaeon]
MKIILLINIFSCLIFYSLAQKIETKQESVSKDKHFQKNEPDKEKHKDFKLSGYAQLSHDFYSLNGKDIAHLRMRRPSNLSRLIVMPTFTWKKIKMPAQFVLSSQATNVVTPPSRFNQPYSIFSQIRNFQDLINYLSNPINRIAINPTFGKHQFKFGTHTPEYSELVQGNISMFGAGYEYNRKNFFTLFSWGITQPAINQDSTQNIRGAYKREQYAFRIGYGNINQNFLAFNVSGGRDVLSSVNPPLIGVKAEQGLAGSLQFQLMITEYLLLQNEFAVSVLTDDLNARQIDFDEFGINVPDIFPINISTRADAAGSTSFGYRKKNVSVFAKALYVGPGYKSFAYPFFQSDRLELTINPQFSFAKNKWFFAGSIGNRTNNLRGTVIAPMNQLIANVNLDGQITEALSISATYGNFGVRNSVLNDTFRVENIAQNISISPTYVWRHEKSTDLFIISYTHDRFEDFNVLTGNLSNNQSNIFLISWNRNFNALPLSVGLSYSNFYFNSPFIKLSNQSLNLNWGYMFFDKKLRTTYSIGRLLNKPEEGASNDRQWVANIGIDFRTKSKYRLGVRWNTNNYVYGTARPNARFNENTLRFNISKQF